MIEILRRDEYDPLHLDLVHLTEYMATMGPEIISISICY